MMFDAVIAIPTYRRLGGLERLLGSLRPSLDSHRVALLIGDNACDPAVRDLVAAFARDYPETRYLAVPDRGISQNRNALLAAWRAHHAKVPWLAMLDDDLVAPPGWLAAMLAAGRSCDADVVGGPYRIDAGPHRLTRLVRNSVLVSRANHPTGPVEVFHAGGNILFSRRILMTEPLIRFDETLGRSGGEDWECLSRLKSRGARFAWAAEALCVEDFPIERASPGYLFGRYFSTGNTMTLIALRDTPRWPVVLRVGRRLLASITRALGHALWLDLDGAVQRSFDAAWAVGGLTGALGLRRSERYR